jgi:hypothetical protein
MITAGAHIAALQQGAWKKSNISISINILLHDFASVHHARMPLDRMLCCGFSK